MITKYGNIKRITARHQNSKILNIHPESAGGRATRGPVRTVQVDDALLEGGAGASGVGPPGSASSPGRGLSGPSAGS